MTTSPKLNKYGRWTQKQEYVGKRSSKQQCKTYENNKLITEHSSDLILELNSQFMRHLP